MSGTGKSREQRSKESALKLRIVEWLDELSTHFNAPQDEEQIGIFLHALEHCSIYQVDEAFKRCLNECEFMPKLAQVHAKMPEQKDPPGKGMFTQKTPVIDLNRPIAVEICPAMTGRSYAEIRELCGEKSPQGEEANKLVQKVFAEANKIRIARGIFE